jgi:hypothetical protein
MAGTGRNFALAAAMLLAVVLAAMLLPSAGWACAVAAVLGVAGIVAFRGNAWRTGSLLVAALALSLALLDAFAGLLTPTAHGEGLVRRTDPRWWPPPHPVLGFRPEPDSKVDATATFDGKPVYRQTYTFDRDGARTTPAGPPGGDVYLFLGDSFMFGQGLKDEEALASQFARATGNTARVVNYGVPGNAPNHLVRALESGLLDKWSGQPVKAVIVWIIPAQLARTTGDGSWLYSSPRYELRDGQLVHTGSFDGYRWSHPLAGLKYVLGTHFAFVDAIGREQRQQEQADLFVAMMGRLKTLVQDKFRAPLVVVYSWPDEKTRSGYGESPIGQQMLVDILARVRRLGVEMVRVDDLADGIPVDRLLIPHDGHPTAFQNGLVADELKKRLRTRARMSTSICWPIGDSP